MPDCDWISLNTSHGAETDHDAGLSQRREGWAAGVSAALPIVAGYVPIGFSFGVLANKAGLSALNTVLMSLIVYAGASQLIAVSLMTAGAPMHSIVLTTFVVNLRHVMFTSVLARHLSQWGRAQLAAFAFHVTDETFVVHTSRFAAGVIEKPAAFATNVTAQVAWVAGTGLGVAAGAVIGDVRRLGLDFALPAMFIALLALQITDWAQVAVAAIAALAAALLLLLAGAGHWTTLIAATVAAAAGVWLEAMFVGHNVSPTGETSLANVKTDGTEQGER